MYLAVPDSGTALHCTVHNSPFLDSSMQEVFGFNASATDQDTI